MQLATNDDDEISLMDIVEFLVNGWKIILPMALIGAVIGVLTLQNLPERFVASGLIQNARVTNLENFEKSNSIGVESFTVVEVEPLVILAEKMQSPTYYDSKTLAICVGDSEAVTLQDFVKSLRPRIVKNSNFVSVEYRAESKDKASRCLEQVLAVVVERQKDLLEATLTAASFSLDRVKRTADLLRKQITALEAERHVESTDEAGYSLRLLLTLADQSKYEDLLALENGIHRMERMLKSPTTQEAKFATPIFSSVEVMSPSRSQIVMIGATAGTLFGVLMLLSRRVFSSLKKRRAWRLKSGSIKS